MFLSYQPSFQFCYLLSCTYSPCKSYSYSQRKWTNENTSHPKAANYNTYRTSLIAKNVSQTAYSGGPETRHPKPNGRTQTYRAPRWVMTLNWILWCVCASRSIDPSARARWSDCGCAAFLAEWLHICEWVVSVAHIDWKSGCLVCAKIEKIVAALYTPTTTSASTTFTGPLCKVAKKEPNGK